MMGPLCADTEKLLIFSQWTDTLDHLEHSLILGNVKCARLDGTMTSKVRQKAIEDFKNNDDIPVFLVRPPHPQPSLPIVSCNLSLKSES